MSTKKYFDKICIVVTALAVAITILFMNGERLGIKKIVDEDAEGYATESGFTQNDMNGEWDTTDATRISLEDDTAVIAGNGAYTYDGDVYISNAGKYVISGKLTNGRLIIDAYDSSKVWILLDGVDIYCEDDAAIRIEQADKVFLTLAEGSTNYVESGEAYSDEALDDNTGGTIFSHDDLTVNGSGYLRITAGYKHGIDCNDYLVIAGGTIEINAPQDGMHVNDGVNIINADITVSAKDDGISAGEKFIMAGGSLSIDECYEGIEAITIEVRDGDITICSSDDGMNANGGSGTGFGMMADQGVKAAVDDTEGSSEEDAETWIHISGGNITILNDSGRDADGLDSNGDIVITGGNILISLVDSGSNNAIDYGSESGGICTISGGRVIACGSSAMVEAFDSSSNQCAILYIYGEGADDETRLTLCDNDGNVILEWEVPYGFSAANLSCPELTTGETYTLYIGDAQEEITVEETSATYGDSLTGGFGQKGNMGGMRQRESFDESQGSGDPENFGNFNKDGFKREERSGKEWQSDRINEEAGSGRMGRMQELDGTAPDNSQMPEIPDGTDFDTSQMPEIPDGTDFDTSQMPEMADGMDFGGGQMPFDEAEMSQAEDETANNQTAVSVTEYGSETLIWLAASAAVMAAGLGFVIFFKKR